MCVLVPICSLIVCSSLNSPVYFNLLNVDPQYTYQQKKIFSLEIYRTCGPYLGVIILTI